MRGCHDEQIPSNLDEFMWFERYGITPQQAWIIDSLYIYVYVYIFSTIYFHISVFQLISFSI